MLKPLFRKAGRLVVSAQNSCRQRVQEVLVPPLEHRWRQVLVLRQQWR